jgi:hypothetical protein
MEQRSADWHNARLGKFTASEIHKLMGKQGLGETGKSYAFEKAVEIVFGYQENDFVSYDMQRGIELEPLAFNKFKELKELNFIDVETCSFFSIDKNSGSSPDGLVSNDSILEIKCPKLETFAKLVATNKIDPKYFLQMQKQMSDTKRSKAYFFNYTVLDGIEYWHEIEVLRCNETIELMNKRISEAVIIRDEFINKLNTNKQW